MNQEKISYGKGETFKAALAFLAQQISSLLVIEVAPHWSNSPPFHGAGWAVWAPKKCLPKTKS